MINNKGNYALINGDLANLRIIHREIIKNTDTEHVWNKSIYHGIKSDKSLECVRYAFDNGCSFYDDIVKDFALNNCLLLLKFAIKNGAKYNVNIIEMICDNIYDEKYNEFVKTLDGNIFNCALMSNKSLIKKTDVDAFKMLRFVHKNCSDIVNLEQKKILVPSWNEETLNLAAKHGYLECVKYLLRYRCEFNKNAYVYAAGNNNHDVLEYLYKLSKIKTIPKWDGDYVIHIAATTSSLECLKFCFFNNCQITNQLCLDALDNSCFKCFKYLHQHGCTISKKKLLKAIDKFKDPEIIKYLKECYKRRNDFNFLVQIRCIIS
jgi:hypothetical protein